MHVSSSCKSCSCFVMLCVSDGLQSDKTTRQNKRTKNLSPKSLNTQMFAMCSSGAGWLVLGRVGLIGNAFWIFWEASFSGETHL